MEANGEAYLTAPARSRTGANFSYATRSVLGRDLYILTRFDNTPRQIAWLRFLVLAAAPLVMLAALYFAYSRAIQSEILQWIDGIKAAMLARKSGVVGALAPVKQRMPSELRDFAVLFNEMSRESAIREQSLKSSIAENEFLLRELNHRVKSSLQIIQSYLSLTRRLDGTTASHSPVAAMEARVQVLSIAYREALSEGRMQDVRIGQFAEEIVDSLSHSFKRPGVLLELKADVQTALMVDRAIPFGLALVESVMAGLDAEGPHAVIVRIGELDDMRVELRVSSEPASLDGNLDSRLMAGLALQLAASVESPDVGTIIRWRFQAGPPPVLVSRREAAFLARTEDDSSPRTIIGT